MWGSHHTYSAKCWHASAAFPQPAECPVPLKSHDSVYVFQLLLTAPTLLPHRQHVSLYPFTRTHSATLQETFSPSPPLPSPRYPMGKYCVQLPWSRGYCSKESAFQAAQASEPYLWVQGRIWWQLCAWDCCRKGRLMAGWGRKKPGRQGSTAQGMGSRSRFSVGFNKWARATPA